MSANARPLAFVTGAARGLGREFVRQLAQEGYEVWGGARQSGDVPGAARMLELDMADPVACDVVAAALRDRALDLLVNNAALRGATGGLGDVTPADFASVMAVNVLGPLMLTRALLPALRRGRGLVANISSRAGSMVEGSDPDGDYAYVASKAALNRVTVKLAEDTGLTVLALHPGWVQTEMGGAGAEVAPAASVAGMLKIIARAGPAEAGRFIAYDGQPIAW